MARGTARGTDAPFRSAVSRSSPRTRRPEPAASPRGRWIRAAVRRSSFGQPHELTQLAVEVAGHSARTSRFPLLVGVPPEEDDGDHDPEYDATGDFHDQT